MKCVWTQKVSLLIDGELESGAAREVERHLDACVDCREAREDFLLLRRQLAAYQIDLGPFAQQRALKRVLASSASDGKIKNDRDAAGSRRKGERFAGVFGMPRLSPVGLAALLLLLVGVAAGLIFLTNARRTPQEIAQTGLSTVSSPAPTSDARHNSKADDARPAPTATANDLTAGTKGEETVAVNDRKPAGEALAKDEALAKGANRRANAFEPTRERAPRAENARYKVKPVPSSPLPEQLRVDVPGAEETAGNSPEVIDRGVRTIESSSESNDANEDILARRGWDVTSGSRTARHVEEAQQLLRSFRNTRFAEAGRRASSDIAYDKRQSKKLLYRNIVLRREAASRGNLPVESLLDSLEPILLDIANLPDKPAPEDVRTINKRMRRKNLVAMLQISSVEYASARNNQR